MAPTNTGSVKPPAEVKSPRAPTSKSSTPKSAIVNGATKSPSLRGGAAARPGRATPVRSSSQNRSDDPNEDEARAQNLALLEELRERTRKAETASEEYQRQLNLLQARLEESQQSQTQLEDQVHERDSKIDDLELQNADAVRQKRDMMNLYESERNALFKEKEEQNLREDDMQNTIKRLKDNLAQREARKIQEDAKETSQNGMPAVFMHLSMANLSKAGDQFAPPSSLQRTSTEDQSKLVATKDRVIDSLRLELAEAQIKIMEIDGMGGGQMHDLEKKLMETKIENARLLEDNESFQLLLSEKTLNGEFSKTEAMRSNTGLGSLAEELGSDDLENAEDKGEPKRNLEFENKSLKDQNRALAVYIEKIIGRLLQHKDFETIFDKNPELLMGAPHPQSTIPADTDKELPPPPPPKDNPPSDGGGGFLQRAKSVVSGTGRRPRPVSHMPSTTESVKESVKEPVVTTPGPNEDPSKAPRIPLGRSTSVRTGHGRSRSDMPNVAPIINQMYRGASPSRLPGPLGSPGLSPPSTAARTSFFSQAASLGNSASRAVSSSRASNTDKSHQEKPPGSSSNSTFSDRSGGVDGASSNAPNNFTGAVMTQNRLRPLRLVQENKEIEGDGKAQEEATAARKKANRTSWMPNWMAQRNASNEQT